MTPDHIAEMERLEKAASPGPWVQHKEAVDGPNFSYGDFEICSTRYCHRHEFEEDEIDNARFIAASRTFVPDALATLKARDEKIAGLTAARNRIIAALDNGEYELRGKSDPEEIARGLVAGLKRWREGLQSLTPGGSEYTEPEECVQFVRRGRERTMRFARRAREAEAEIASLTARLATGEAQWKAAQKHGDWLRECLDHAEASAARLWRALREATDDEHVEYVRAALAASPAEASVARMRTALERITSMTSGGSQHARSIARAALAAEPEQAPAPEPTIPLADACKPWEFHHGPPPDYDSPLSAVYGAGIQYAMEALASLLGVTDWTVSDGSEDFDQDLKGTLRNILVTAGYSNSDGDHLSGKELIPLADAVRVVRELHEETPLHIGSYMFNRIVTKLEALARKEPAGDRPGNYVAQSLLDRPGPASVEPGAAAEIKETEHEFIGDDLRCCEVCGKRRSDEVHVLPNGWKPWHGGECPVPPETAVEVEVRFKGGSVSGPPVEAQYRRWEWNHEDGDIIAYRVVKPATSPDPRIADVTRDRQQVFSGSEGLTAEQAESLNSPQHRAATPSPAPEPAGVDYEALGRAAHKQYWGRPDPYDHFDGAWTNVARAVIAAYEAQRSASPQGERVEELEAIAAELCRMASGIESDLLSAHHNRGNGSSEGMTEDDREQRADFRQLVERARSARAPQGGLADDALRARPEAEPARWPAITDDMVRHAEAVTDFVLPTGLQNTSQNRQREMRMALEVAMEHAPAPPPTSEYRRGLEAAAGYLDVQAAYYEEYVSDSDGAAFKLRAEAAAIRALAEEGGR